MFGAGITGAVRTWDDGRGWDVLVSHSLRGLRFVGGRRDF